MFFRHIFVVKTQLCVVHVLSTNKITPIEFVTFLEMDRFLTNHSLEFQEILLPGTSENNAYYKN